MFHALTVNARSTAQNTRVIGSAAQQKGVLLVLLLKINVSYFVQISVL